jgi:hypothetical protein
MEHPSFFTKESHDADFEGTIFFTSLYDSNTSKSIFLTEQNVYNQPGTVSHPCNPSTQEAEAQGLRVQGQPGLHSKTMSKEKK